jgi:hypothetical protein
MTSLVINEAGIREEIIAPILRRPHYSFRGLHDIRYEVTLAYPHDSLGRKKKSDPVLIGKPDYICRAGGRVPWTIEAKAPQPISKDDVEQAYTYAKHPEVRGVYFCLCNGVEFRVYDTNSDPSVPPILVLTDLEDAERCANHLRNLLGPDSLLARHALIAADTQPAIGQGLRSYVEIVGGRIAHKENTLKLPVLTGFTISVIGGAIQRVDDGSLMVVFEGRAPYLSVQELLDRLGLKRVEAYTESKQLSTDSAAPTVFSANMTAIFPEGEQLTDISSNTSIVLGRPLKAEIRFTATGALNGTTFGGAFQLDCTYRDGATADSPILTSLSSFGDFEFLLR